MESGKHKKRINYTVMIVSDSTEGGIHPFYLEQRLVTTLLCLIALVLAVSLGVAIHHSVVLGRAQAQEAEMQKQIEKLTEEKQALTTENSELSDKVAILSDTVAQNAQTQEEQEQEEQEKKIPNGFPLAGPAVILESSETAAQAQEADGEETQEDGMTEPIVVFSASEGTKVIASASGVVSEVTDDSDYGYRVTIDHENGYISIYRAASAPMVAEGDTVEPGTLLYQMQSAEEKLGYQITQDGAFIDPLDLLEVYG